MKCAVYRCSRQDEMYVYLPQEQDIEQLPEGLLKQTGRLSKAMDLELTPEKRLARADVTKVIEQIASKGFYLQMPPSDHINGHLHFGD